MQIYLGCELHSSMDMVECLKKGRRLTMAGSRYVLVEFSNNDEKSYIEERIQKSFDVRFYSDYCTCGDDIVPQEMMFVFFQS